MLKEVFSAMRFDETGNVARSDSLIVALGESWLRRFIDNKRKRKYYASQHMRLMARLLMYLRHLDEIEILDSGMETNKNQTVSDCEAEGSKYTHVGKKTNENETVSDYERSKSTDVSMEINETVPDCERDQNADIGMETNENEVANYFEKSSKKNFADYLNTKCFDSIVAAALACCAPYMDDIADLKAPSNSITRGPCWPCNAHLSKIAL